MVEEIGNILGIDFGTTNSKMAYMLMDEPMVIQNSEGKVMTPSVVYFNKKNKAIVGEHAKQHIILHPDKTIYSIKRHMGTEYKKQIGKERYPPEFIAAHILRKLAKDAESETSREFKNAVISVPANYSDGQRQSIKDAAEIAGLNVLRMINEPTAAALAYGYREDEERKILIYDFGGGTFDVSILTVGNGFFDVDATSGMHRLGGDDMDEQIVDFICKKIKKERKIDVKKNLALYQSLREAAEEAKIKLSTEEKTTINLPFIGKTTKHTPFEIEITRTKFEELILNLIKKTGETIRKALDDAGLDKSEIDDVILVGGTTKIPLVKDFVKKFFNKEPASGIDPYEAVALGTAIASASESKEKSKIDVSDVISMSLGVETADGTISRILESNTKVPIARTKQYTNPHDFMSEVEVAAYQGEGLYPWECEHLGEFWVSLEPKPMWTNNIDICFEVGEEFGILKVTARDRDSGSERSVKLRASGRLSKKEKNKWMKKILSSEGIELYILNRLTMDGVSLSVNPNTKISELKTELKNLGTLSEEGGIMLFHKNKELDEKLSVADINYTFGDIIEINKKETVKKRTNKSLEGKNLKKHGKK
jgi:molecular chaperone DnaK